MYIACQLKNMGNLNTPYLSNEIMYQYVKNNPIMLEGYYANCIEETRKVAENFINVTDSLSSQGNLTSSELETVNEAEAALHQTLNKILFEILSLSNTNTTPIQPLEKASSSDDPPLTSIRGIEIDQRIKGIERLRSLQNTLSLDAQNLSARSSFLHGSSAPSSTFKMHFPSLLYSNTQTTSLLNTKILDTIEVADLKTEVSDMLSIVKNSSLIDLNENTDLVTNPVNDPLELESTLKSEIEAQLTYVKEDIEELYKISETKVLQYRDLETMFYQQLKMQATTLGQSIEALSETLAVQSHAVQDELFKQLNTKINSIEKVLSNFQNDIKQVLNKEAIDANVRFTHIETNVKEIGNKLSDLKQEANAFMQQFKSLPSDIKNIKELKIEYYKQFEKTILDLNKSMVIIKKAVYPTFFSRLKKLSLNFGVSFLIGSTIKNGVNFLSHIMNKSLNSTINRLMLPQATPIDQLRNVLLGNPNNNYQFDTYN
uniref:Putative regulator of FtsZ n=1 Tax=Oedogonium cardiacum TaxID=55995 RepID=B3V4R7_OEDCA|nr:putative regulator of FtsZ [Oedogonium cardiacum]YP_002000456.1 putative regulator of FtsZ [Oedogonium cardiacum]ACC97282.1 putative regulator of FtsZ [Oedogonium cardiacum]ACC97292.1 putative regulator of FtsZ [Oedogonium cardiacum]